ncbi:MAG: VOC family protein, partial [Actinobacteria bacterium]|nr:VOC family protein [Actinomycetota bacterium]
MPTRDHPPIGAPCWVDLMTSDLGRARAFYSELFGWESTEPAEEFGGYVNFTKDGTMIAGCMPAMPGGDVSDVWSVYLATDDAKKTVEAAAAAGSQVIVPATDVGTLGTMGVVTAPGGAATGLWQGREHQGFGRYGEPGTPSWFQLNTREYDAAVAFLRDVFRWDTQSVSDAPEFRYTVLTVGDEQLAGVMDAT